MLDCKEVIELASRSQDNTLPWRQRWTLNSHLLICKTCREYDKQIRFIKQAVQAMDRKIDGIKLSDQARTRIAKHIKSKIQLK